MGIKRIESVYKVEERRKEKIETSSGVINKQEPEVEERRKEKMETTSTMINKQKPEVEERRKEKNGDIFYNDKQTNTKRRLNHCSTRINGRSREE